MVKGHAEEDSAAHTPSLRITDSLRCASAANATMGIVASRTRVFSVVYNIVVAGISTTGSSHTQISREIGNTTVFEN